MQSPGGNGVFRQVGDEAIYSGRVFRVATRTLQAPDGSRFTRDVVLHLGAVAAVPLVERAGGPAVVMVRQYRAALDTTVLEIPAGKRDVPDEPPDETVTRELAEEIGMNVGSLTKLGELLTSPGFSDERCIVFLARDLTPCPPDRHGFEEQAMEVVEIPFADAWDQVTTGEILDAKTVVGLALAREVLDPIR